MTSKFCDRCVKEKKTIGFIEVIMLKKWIESRIFLVCRC